MDQHGTFFIKLFGKSHEYEYSLLNYCSVLITYMLTAHVCILFSLGREIYITQ